MEYKTYTVRKTLRLTPADAKLLKAKANEAKLNENEYLRLILSHKPNDYPEIRKLLKDLINEVNHIGVNINQIVFNHNAGFYSKQDKEHLVAYMKKLNMAVNEVVSLIGNQ